MLNPWGHFLSPQQFPVTSIEMDADSTFFVHKQAQRAFDHEEIFKAQRRVLSVHERQGNGDAADRGRQSICYCSGNL